MRRLVHHVAPADVSVSCDVMNAMDPAKAVAGSIAFINAALGDVRAGAA